MSIQRIPKIFFQTSREPLDAKLNEMIKQHLTDSWSYMHFLDSDIIEFMNKNPIEEFPNSVEKFKAIKRGEHKADFFRYYFLYVNGGVFMDSDAMIYQDIDSIIKSYAFFSVKSSYVQNTLFQGIIGAEPQHPIIHQALRTLYNMDLNYLVNDYHYLCKDIYKIYMDHIVNIANSEKEMCLYNEDRGKQIGNVVNSEGTILFRHYWGKKEGIPMSLKKKNLVYCCVFYNKDYLKLLNLLLASVAHYSKKESWTFLIITSKEFESNILAFSDTYGIYLRTFTIDLTTIFQAACARLFIFDYPEIGGYEKLLYLDTDIIIKGDLSKIFTLDIEDLLYGIESGKVDSYNFGGQFFNFEQIDRSLAGINSGTLLFLNSENMKNLFGRIRNHINQFTDEGKPVPYCMDQPFINYHAIKDSLYNNKVLNPLVSLFEGNDTVDNYSTSVICHFSFPIGNFGHKFYRMKKFLDITLNRQINSYAPIDLIGRKYSWNGGFIKFVTNESGSCSINTSWGKGEITILDSNIVRVEWNSFVHIISFNETLTSYISTRLWPNDFDITTGNLLESSLNIYGDSHSFLLFRNLAIEHRNLFQFSKTMYSLGRDTYITNFNECHNNPNTIFCFTYGEVDVRANIGKQVHYGRNHVTVCNELVDCYFKAIKHLIKNYKAIIIVAVPPPCRKDDHSKCNLHTEITGGPLPFIGTDSDRLIYTQYMNTLLETACKEYGYYFFNPFDYYKREDGMLNYSISDGCIHIGKNEEFLNAFMQLYKSLA